MISTNINTTKMRAERLRRGLSQIALSYLSGVSASDVSKIETGKLQPYPSQGERLAQVLGLQPSELQKAAGDPNEGLEACAAQGAS